jgi:hypothetical protein
MNIIFSIFIDIPEDKLDNPGWYENGVQVKTDKSLNTKNALYNNRVELERRQREYAESLNVEYRLLSNDKEYKDFCKYMKDYPMISEYDIINFYKHWAMKNFAENYDQVCYLDFDVVPNTDENVFNTIKSGFGVADSNDLAAWGKNISATKYNTCIRNPSSKYWNTYAMLLEDGLEPENDVFNTGIMVAGYNIIQELGYFHEFDKTLNLMTYLKEEEASMHPPNIQRIFNYDNETVFSYLVTKREIDIDWLPKEWHYIVDQPKKEMVDTRAKLYHVINKKVEWVL